jgi:hypothetical protein
MPAQQQKLPGVGPKQIPEIEDKALELRKIRSKRQELAAKEEELQGKLVDLLRANGFRKGRPYQFEEDADGETIKLDVVMEQKDVRAYVRKHKDKEAEEEEGDGD